MTKAINTLDRFSSEIEAASDEIEATCDDLRASTPFRQAGPDINPTDPNFATLAGILQAAHDQAANGKGRNRYGEGKPFLNQPIMDIARMLGGIDGHSFQIMKKAQEAARMVRREQYDAAVHELLGVINYAAAAVLRIREL